LAEARVYSPTPERRGKFAAEMRERLGIPVEAVASARAAIEGVDIVATATNSSTPVLEADWLAPGMHVGFIREYEMSDAALERADRVIVHTRQGEINHHTPVGQDALADLQRARGVPWGGYPELADVLAGVAPGRASADEITLFMNNFGIGIQFAALGARAYQGARAAGLGRELPDDWFLETIRP
jgi:ornithine cyclodeaminase/alanine dehydrogenase-like protein (mu-crystallin family)